MLQQLGLLWLFLAASWLHRNSSSAGILTFAALKYVENVETSIGNWKTYLKTTVCWLLGWLESHCKHAVSRDGEIEVAPVTGLMSTGSGLAGM